MAKNDKSAKRFVCNRAAAGLIATAIALPGLTLANIDIVFDYSFDTSSFFTSEVQNILEDVATFYETHIEDDLTAIESDGQNNFEAIFFNPSTGVSETISNFDVAADTLIIYLGASELGSTTLGVGGPGGFGVNGTTAFVNNAITRGETPTTSGTLGSTATDFAPWGGSISFDIDNDWYFDTDTSTDESFGSMDDFYSVALHEMAHVLGFGTADSFDNLVDSANDEFTGSAAVAEFGGDVPLNTDESHWENGTQSTVFGTPISQEAAMDPKLTVGTRKRMTDLDMAGLADIGWEIAAASAQ